MKRGVYVLLLLLSVRVAVADALPGDELPWPAVQVIGTHNSYRTRPPEPMWSFLQKLPKSGIGDPRDLDYGHAPLGEQLEAGVRSVELDLYADPGGGRYARRAGLALAGGGAVPDEERKALAAPGIKVLHLPDFDFGTNCLTFRGALASIRAWSAAHPRHVPVVIHLETKDETVRQSLPLPGLAAAAPWDAAACDALDAEIASVFAPIPENPASGPVFTPDALRGSHSDLTAAVRAGAWPKLGALRGRVLFVMEGAAVPAYREGRPALQGRRCFVYGRAGGPETAFLLMNDALGQREAIRARVSEGYLVRTRADSGTKEARSGDTARREAAFSSGAHIISTDYPVPDARAGREPGWTDYAVRLPGGGVVRPNPVTAAGRPGPVCEE
jgi:hypothetical protein